MLRCPVLRFRKERGQHCILELGAAWIIGLYPRAAPLYLSAHPTFARSAAITPLVSDGDHKRSKAFTLRNLSVAMPPPPRRFTGAVLHIDLPNSGGRTPAFPRPPNLWPLTPVQRHPTFTSELAGRCYAAAAVSHSPVGAAALPDFFPNSGDQLPNHAGRPPLASLRKLNSGGLGIATHRAAVFS
jgi:hypothetical protein